MAAAGADYVQHVGLGSHGNCVRFMPSAPAGLSDLDGRVKAHKLIALGTWDDDAERNFLMFHSMGVITRGGKVVSTDLQFVTSFTHAGKMTDLKVAEAGGNVLVLFGTTEGTLFLTRLIVPFTPGAGAEDLQVVGLSPDSEELEPWLQPHTAAVTAVDIQADTKNILSVGQDSIHVLTPESSSESIMAPFKAGSGFVSYTTGRWVDSQHFVTSSTLGGLEYWDTRQQGARPAMRSPQEWGATGCGQADRGCRRQVYSLQVHPSRPNLCATGGSQGTVALWDLRFAQRPLSLTAQDVMAGPVWEVHFDPLEHYSSDTAARGGPQHAAPSVLYATDDGQLARTHSTATAAAGTASTMAGLSYLQGQQSQQQGQGQGQQQHNDALGCSVLLQEPAAINSFDVESGYGQDIVGVTDRQTLLYINRSL